MRYESLYLVFFNVELYILSSFSGLPLIVDSGQHALSIALLNLRG